MTSAPDYHQLNLEMQKIAHGQIYWAKNHGAIFDVHKSKWMIFSPREEEINITIDFGERRALKPVKETKWLGVTIDNNIKFKKHRSYTIAKGLKRANFLSSLSNTRWGIPPNLFRILLMATVHAATDYGAAAWLTLPISIDFGAKLKQIDHIVARKALGALKSTPSDFLYHDLNLIDPITRLTGKIAAYMATAMTRPQYFTLAAYVHHGRTTIPRAHKSPFHCFFQSRIAQDMANFIPQPIIDPLGAVSATDNVDFIVQSDKERAIADTKRLTASPKHLILYSDGSRIPGKNTAAATWCENTKHRHVLQLGPVANHGIYEAEYKGVELAVRLAGRIATEGTRRISIILDNQSVIKDLQAPKFSPTSLNIKSSIFSMTHFLSLSLPLTRVSIRWCPGHKGVEGNETVDKLANKAARSVLPPGHTDNTNLAAFKAAIRDWAQKSQTLSPATRKRLGHEAMQSKHLKAISKLRKHAGATITQMRSGHVPLYSYLHRISLRHDPECECTMGVETTEHYVLLCPLHTDQRTTLKNELRMLDIDLNMKILHNPKAYQALAAYIKNTWRFSNRWDWAELVKEPVPEDRTRRV